MSARLPLAALLLAGVFAACTSSPTAVGHLALPLDVAVLPAADAVDLTILVGETEESSHRLTPPWGEAPVLDVSPGPGRSRCRPGSATCPRHRDAPFTVAEARPSMWRSSRSGGRPRRPPPGIERGGVTGVLAEALDSPRGFFQLAAEGAGFSATLPAGRVQPAVRPRRRPPRLDPRRAGRGGGRPGVRRSWAEPFVAPDAPLPIPGVAVRPELEVPGGALLGGLLPVASDVIRPRPRRRRPPGPGYRGQRSPSPPRGWPASCPRPCCPLPYRFDEADAGEHTFGGLQAAVSLLAGTLA
ncbi:MAG: hypothetical protein R3F43_27960 [bacterium]